MCRSLCRATTRQDMSIAMISTQMSDSIMYQLFGFKKKRINLLEFLRPHTSCVTTGQTKVYELLANSSPASRNFLVSFPMVLTFAMSWFAEMRRRHLQISVGIVDASELRLQQLSCSFVIIELKSSTLSWPTSRRSLTVAYLCVAGAFGRCVSHLRTSIREDPSSRVYFAVVMCQLMCRRGPTI